MKRRSFLKSATLAGAAGSVPLAIAQLAAAAEPRFALWRAASAAAGTPYAPFAVSACDACDADTLRVRMDGLRIAAGSRLRAFSLSALFDDAGVRAPFLAWHYGTDGGTRMSQRMSFVAGRASMRGLTLEYRHEGDAACRTQDCALTRFETPLLAPGHYVLVDTLDAAGLAHSGNALAPLGERSFDYLAFRIEPLS